jgi:hypothetical protein
MKQFKASGALLMSSLLLAIPARANESVAPEQTYRTIIERNPFGLRPPPPPAVITNKLPEAPKSDLKLTGITSLGKKKAWFRSEGTPQRGKQPAEGAELFSLGEDEKKDGLEVLEISKTGVRVRNGGIETLMTFATHGVAPPPVAAAPAPGATAPPGAGAIPRPGVATYQPAAVNTATPGSTPSGARPLPSRTVRTATPTYSAGATSVGGMPQDMAARYGLSPVQLPNAQQQHQQQAQPQGNMSPEQHMLLMELQKATQPDVVFPPTPGLSDPAVPTIPPLPGSY